MKKPQAKINEIKRQKAYVLENAKKAREVFANEEAAKNWESMAEAYSIALQIHEETGDYMPEEVEKEIVKDLENVFERTTVEELEIHIEAADIQKHDLPTWEYAEYHAIGLRIEAYQNVLWRKQEAMGVV
jgi:hypothetical protein